MIKIATSLLSSTNRIDDIKKLNNTSTDYIHIDVMDNIFVPNYQLPLKEVEELKKVTTKPFDIHLMMENPQPFIENITKSFVDSITIHIEINQNINEIIDIIKKHNYKVGLAIKPNTDISVLKEYIDKIDKILIMSVEPGFGGQKFIENTIDRILELKKTYPHIPIEVDGGINEETINKIKIISDIAVVGSFIINSNNFNKAINNLKF